MISVVIIHSDIEAMEQIKLSLNIVKDQFIIENSFDSAEHAFDFLKNNKIDWVINEAIDSNLTIYDIKDLIGDEFKAKIVLISNKLTIELALNAIRNQVFDIFTFPIKIKEVNSCIERYNKLLKKSKKAKIDNQDAALSLNDKNFLRVNTHENQMFIHYNEIDYLVANGAYTIIHFGSNKSVKISKNLGVLLKTMKDYSSLKRISRFCVLNFKQIEKIIKNKTENWQIFFKSGNTFEVSRVIGAKISTMFEK
jgi:DNA-binding LytR/AlgR family response regulator